MKYTALFQDGPLGGQYRELSEREHIIRVPVMPRCNLADYGRDVPVPPLEVETYELVGYASSGMTLAYRWVNPAEGLRAEVKRLRAKVVEAQDKLRDVQRGLSC